MIEARPHFGSEDRLGRGLRPVQKEVIVVQHVLRLLGGGVACEELSQLVLPSRAPWERAAQHLAERRLTIDDARVNPEAGCLARKAVPRGGEPQLMPDDGEQVFGIAAVVNRECIVQTDALRVLAQQTRTDAVKGA